jgi:hypothetical protein
MENMESKFDFFERVKILSPLIHKEKQPNLEGLVGIIFGKAQNDDGNWCYRLKIGIDKEAYYFQEHELESLGTFAKREDYYSGDTIKVTVVPNKKGELIGMLKEDYEKMKKKKN